MLRFSFRRPRIYFPSIPPTSVFGPLNCWNHLSMACLMSAIFRRCWNRLLRNSVGRCIRLALIWPNMNGGPASRLRRVSFRKNLVLQGIGTGPQGRNREDQFKIFWETLWLVSDDGGSMVLAQPTRFLRDLTAPHLAAISKVADREVELVVGQKPPPGSRKAEAGPWPIRDVIKGK